MGTGRGCGCAGVRIRKRLVTTWPALPVSCPSAAAPRLALAAQPHPHIHAAERLARAQNVNRNLHSHTHTPVFMLQCCCPLAGDMPNSSHEGSSGEGPTPLLPPFAPEGTTHRSACSRLPDAGTTTCEESVASVWAGEC